MLWNTETVREATNIRDRNAASHCSTGKFILSVIPRAFSSPATIRRVVMTSPVKSCTLDPVPTFLLREFIDLLLPYVTTMVNRMRRCLGQIS